VECHADQQAAWTGSHHDLAMQEATAATVLGNFDNARFEYAGIASEFFRRDGKFMVRTDGADGALADFDVRYVFGVEPLQQYLLELPGGRLQALSIAWDTRPAEQGGQRWFHLYPDEKIRHDDELHWTGLQQNWNYMCAECHSTNLQRNYDAAKQSYATTWSEIDVSCEACHGPGSNHVAWAKDGGDASKSHAGNRGLLVQFDERRGVNWTINAETGKPARSTARATTRELDTCARCHSRRGQVWADYTPGRPIGDTHRVASLDPGLYFPDGQIHDEVYEYGSFLQSRMHQAGVSCSDCHEPHSLKLRADGDAVCMTCHQAARYESTEHHHHEAGSAGSQCVECHMPGRNYMVVDNRRDHSLRVPRPDLGATTGSPDACTACHRGQKPEWAAGKLREWLGRPPAGLQDYAEILHAGDTAAAGARERLLELAGDLGQPGIARASALQRLDRITGPEMLNAVSALLRDPNPLVRRAAASAHRLAPADRRAGLVAVLDDPVRDVRLEATPLVAEMPTGALQPAQAAARDRAMAEYVASQELNADRPESHVNLGLLYAATGSYAEARAAFEQALTLDPRFTPAAVNLADLHRALGQEADAEAVLRSNLAINPEAAALHHALGLLLVRTGRADAALAELQKAAEQAPDEARYAYVHAVALEGAGQRANAIRALRQVLVRHPNDRDTIWALASYQLESGHRGLAIEAIERLVALEPGDPDVRALAERAGIAGFIEGSNHE
jgi:tetratricopeptide (TPR) repeat protein